jgi:RNA polymerase sigma factor (TIGR02999 family)
MESREPNITHLLENWRNGDERALSELIPLVYDELRSVASRHMRRENPGHTLQTTALVHEVYVKMVDADVSWQNRVHFFAVAAKMVRRLLVDHAKTKRRLKRGGDAVHTSLDQAASITPEPADLLDVHDALTRLGEFDPKKSEIIELLFFGGLTQEESSEALGMPLRTLEREVRLAKAWLYRELRKGEAGTI